jgi:anti-sigma regulatory factor (Ser/Thr protein kinase)
VTEWRPWPHGPSAQPPGQVHRCRGPTCKSLGNPRLRRRVTDGAAGYHFRVACFGRMKGDMEISRELSKDVQAPKSARRMVAQLLRGYDSGVLEVAQLLANELVANVLKHTSGRPRIVLRLDPGCLHIEVSDDSPERPSLLAGEQTDEQGRGLTIVDALATRWGTQSLGTGKVVWCDLDLVGPESRMPAAAGSRLGGSGKH